MSTPPNKNMLPVVIVGAGISGLALAQFLLSNNIPFQLFERDISLSARLQGYRVRINSAGIAAFSSLLSPALFVRLKACCGIVNTPRPDEPSYTHLDAITGEKVQAFPLPKENTDPLCVDRSVVRDLMMRGLEPFVHFGKEFLRYEILDNGIKVHFKDGTNVTGSFLVGADGTNSPIRKQLLFPKSSDFIDTEGRWFFGKTLITADLEKTFNENALNNYSLIQEHSSSSGMPLSLLLEPVRFRENEYRVDLPHDYMYWVFGGHKSLIATPDVKISRLSPADMKKEIMNLTKIWHASYHSLFELSDEGKIAFINVKSQNPTIPVWKTQEHVTLVGDSIHGMNPTAGIGSVTALRSTAILAEAIKEGWTGTGVDLDAMTKYENEMRKFAGEAIERSFFAGTHIFGLKTFEELKKAKQSN